MFTRIPSLRNSLFFSRKFSSQLSSTFPSSKVRAFPFRISPEDALLQMAPWAASTSSFRALLDSLGARFLPGFGFKPFLPVQLTPVYFPGWIIDAEAEVNIRVGDTKRAVTSIVHDSYLPGCDFHNLSLVCFSPRKLGYQLDLVELTEDLRVQFGEQVAFLPYTISPFSPLEIAHSFGNRQVTLDDDLRVSPSTLKMNLFAAYPVLFPLYLARYDYSSDQTDPQYLTLFMEAWTPKGQIMAESPAHIGTHINNLLPEFLLRPFGHVIEKVNTVPLRGILLSFIQVAGPPEVRRLPSFIEKWADHILEQPRTPGILASRNDELDFDNDPRIRPYSGDERIAIHKWMSMSNEIASLKMIVEGMDSSDIQVVISGRRGVSREEVVDTAVKTLKDQIKTLETKRSEDQPSWWKEWLEKSKLKEQIT